MSVAILKSQRDADGSWGKIIAALKRKGLKVHYKPVKADVYIVLGGRFENPLCMKGKRILVFHKSEWAPSETGWDYWYGHLMQEYYDTLIDCTGASLGDVVKTIQSQYDANS